MEALYPQELPKPTAPFSQVTVGTGTRQVFISGQVPEDAEGNLVGPGDIGAQCRQVLHNIGAAIEAAGGIRTDICKMTVFVTRLDPETFSVLGEARREFFGRTFPASTMVVVSGLAKPEWLIEIEAYAVI